MLIDATGEHNMNLAHAIEGQMTRQVVQHPGSSFHGNAPYHPLHHRDPSPVISLLVVIGFVAMLIGVIVFTTYQERAGKSKVRESAHNIPMVHMR